MKHYYNVKNYARTPEIQDLPSLIDIQLKSFDHFLRGGKLLELFDEINPITSFNGNLSLYFPGNDPQAQEFGLEFRLDEPKYNEEECIERDMSFSASLHAKVALVNHEQADEFIVQEIFLGEFPLMTEKGTFIINGTERVVVSQLIRSPGVYFDGEEERTTGRYLANCKLIPDRGAWMEFETRKTDYITVKFNRKRTIPVTILLRALAAAEDGMSASRSPIKTGDDEEILALFKDIDTDENHRYIETCIQQEPVWDLKKRQTIGEAALIEFFRRVRPGDPPTLDNARSFLEEQLFDKRRYDLERVGRYKLNRRLDLDEVVPREHRTLTKYDIVELVRHMVEINNADDPARHFDDIDHLGSRRVKTVGELIGNKLRVGLRRMERVVRERMSIREADQLAPVSLINIRPIVAAVREFFGSSQLSQFMEQTNPLSELTHKRTLSALGPGGLRRERAGFDVRDVHHSHYGRICPIETPEGPNIGLIGRLASYARVNELGFIETPYRKVINSLPLDDERLPGRVLNDDIEAVLSLPKGAVITEDIVGMLRYHQIDTVAVHATGVLEAVENRPVDESLIGIRIGADVTVGVVRSQLTNLIDAVRDQLDSRTLSETREEFDALYIDTAGPIISAADLVWENRDSLTPQHLEQFDEAVGARAAELEGTISTYLNARIGLRSAIEALTSALEKPPSRLLDVPKRFDQLYDEAAKYAGKVGDFVRMAEKSLNGEQLSPREVSRTMQSAYNCIRLFHEKMSKADEAVERALKPLDDLQRSEVMTERRIIAAKGDIIDAATLQSLRMHGMEQVPVVVLSDDGASEALPVSDGLIGRMLHEAIDSEALVLEEGEVIDADALRKLRQAGFDAAPIAPFASHEITYLSADQEDEYTIAQANAVLDERGQFVSNRVSARLHQQFMSVPPHRIEHMDVAPRQIVGISAALIPFLSHDAANRALMGSNMQRQAVPLITPDVSVVSTGMERQAASSSGQVLVSEVAGEVISVQGHRVIVRKSDGEEESFPLRKYERSNQSTCIDQRPQVRKGDMIQPGDIIADSSSTYNGHLALGQDVLTCFLSWDGGNYEDALLVSEDLLRSDKFTSIHIEKYEIEARDTKLGAEEITYDIPNVGEEALKDLDQDGIVRIGAEVGPNDILVGKITPKGEKELSPEEKLLRAIFGEHAREVRDSSLRLPHGDRGKVIDVKVFNREEHPDLQAGVENMVRVSVAQRRKLTVGDKMAGRHGNKGVISKIVTVEDMPYIDGGIPCEIILNPLGVPSRMNIGQILELHLGWAADRLGFRAITPVFDGVQELEIQAELGRAWLIDWAWKLTTARAWENQARMAASAGMQSEDFDDDMHVICAYLLDLVGDSGEYDNEKIILERQETYVRRVAVGEILREHGFDPAEIMVYNNEGLSAEVRDRRDANALDVSLRLWIQHHAPDEVQLADDLSARELFEVADRVMFATNVPVPHYGKMTLYDGRTGEKFDRPVAVGYVHMLKLAHLVEDKAHARSTGPYSLVTQQPLGGKAQFGGQRFGEMEVWALEAYGAAHILQEMLTVKSDDVQGRVKTYESIVKGEPIEEPGIPTSFRVLVKELQSLGLSVEAITGTGDVIRFGKYDEQYRRPQPETGLLGLGAARSAEF
ncbi:MAG: DNA-directed RNA polymerase subunit beta [Chloroflexi bacterium]|nr:DNA-directed RNA polymerase subunit beta [Chloroflexota bacterium]